MDSGEHGSESLLPGSIAKERCAAVVKSSSLHDMAVLLQIGWNVQFMEECLPAPNLGKERKPQGTPAFPTRSGPGGLWRVIPRTSLVKGEIFALFRACMCRDPTRPSVVWRHFPLSGIRKLTTYPGPADSYGPEEKAPILDSRAPRKVGDNVAPSSPTTS